jgi:hypothetical protein
VNIAKLLLGAMVLMAEMTPQVVFAQMQVPVFGDGPIPDQPFRTWSLFLMCNPEWLLDQKAEALGKVFDAYLAFGRTSGRDHAAVWFVNQKMGVGDPGRVAADPKNIDVERSVTYCQRFGLVPSEGPHVVVTTTYPDRWVASTTAPEGTGDPIVVVALGGSSPDDIVELLKRLNDQIATERLSAKEIASEQYWRSWVRALENVCHRVFDKAKFTVTAKVFSIERTGLCN